MMLSTQKDQGWAWVVLAASAASLYIFMIQNASTGFFQIEMKEDLGVGAGPISIIGALAAGQSCILGPLSGLLASLLSVRVTVHLGVIIFSAGLVMASFCQSLASLTFFYGFMTGFGYGIAYTASIIVISLHFDRHRLLANGIIMCAPGLGMLSHPHVLTWGISTHGWRWTCTLTGAAVLQVAVLASLYFPTEMERQTMIDWKAVWKRLRNKGEVVAQEEEEESCEVDKSEGLDKLDVALQRSDRGQMFKDDLAGNDAEERITLLIEEAGKENVNNPHNLNHVRELICTCECGREKEVKSFQDKNVPSNRAGNEEEASKKFKICDCIKKLQNHYKTVRELKKESNVSNNSKNIDSSNKNFIRELENLSKQNSKNASNPKAFISTDDLKIETPVHKQIDYILKWDETNAFNSSLKSLPLSLSKLGSVSGCPSPLPMPSPVHKHKEPALTDFTKNTAIRPGSLTHYGKHPLNPAVLNISAEHFGNLNSLTPLQPRKRSQSCFSHQFDYSSQQEPAKATHSHISINSTVSGLRGRANSWLQSQADVMGSSLVLPMKVEVEEVDLASEMSLKKNLKLVLHSKAVWILCLNAFCFTFGYGMVVIHFPAFAESQGVSRDNVSKFYSAYGLALLISRLGGGIMLNSFTSKPPLALISCVLHIFLGLFLGLSPFYATGQTGLFIMQGGIAFTYGAGYMLYAPMCAQILSVDLIAISFGLVQLFHGIAYLVSPVIAGSMVTMGAFPLVCMKCVKSRPSEQPELEDDMA